MDEIYNNIGEYNPNKKRKILIVFDTMVLLCLVIKILNSLVTELFARILRFARNFLEHFSCFYYTMFSCCTKNH